MAASSRLMIGEAERRFPVRIRLGVPPEGFGSRLDELKAWVDDNCGAAGWAMTPSRRHGRRGPMTVEAVIAGGGGVGDVLVRIQAAGVCHTDLQVISGSLRYPMPIVLGHEAAGVVEELGPAAQGLAVGDHVVLSWNPHC